MLLLLLKLHKSTLVEEKEHLYNTFCFVCVYYTVLRICRRATALTALNEYKVVFLILPWIQY